jgi:hypothetical protein
MTFGCIMSYPDPHEFLQHCCRHHRRASSRHTEPDSLSFPQVVCSTIVVLKCDPRGVLLLSARCGRRGARR